MSVARLKTWSTGETLTASDLNAEINNILNNGEDLGFPATKAKDMDAQQILLDGDQDTHITADTDDRIDFAVGGVDGFRIDGTTASSVNGIDVATAATGNNPEIKAQGSDTNIGITLTPKGTGNVSFSGGDLIDSNGNEVFTYAETASAVNQAHFVNAATGNAPGIGSEGESDIGFELLDSNQNQVIIGAATASAVNEVTVTNQATGTGPTVAATGGDTDIDLNLVPKGAGQVQFGGVDLATVMRGHIDGLILSNDTDTDHDINITAGVATAGDQSEMLVLSSETTKQIDASWSAGDDAGGLSSSLSLSADTWYHVIVGTVSGTADVGFDTSATGSNLVTDHSFSGTRRIGAVLTDGSSNIIAFSQVGNEFVWDVPVADRITANPGTSAVLTTLSVPSGVNVVAITGVDLVDSSPAADTNLLLTSPDQTDSTPTASLRTVLVGTSALYSQVYARIRTNTSSQVRTRQDNSDAGVGLKVFTYGWVDPRGRE